MAATSTRRPATGALWSARMPTLGATKIEGTAGTRWTYTASGPVTNGAARLAALGDDVIHLGAATASRLPTMVGIEDLGEVALRNVEEPTRVFRLAPPQPVAATV